MKLKDIRRKKKVNKMLEAFNEKYAERILKHERLLPHLDEIRSYLNIHNSINKINEEIKSEEPELANKRREVNETLNAISKLITSKVEMQNADDALTKFRDRVIYFMTNKINAERSLDEQKSKLSNHLKKPVLSQYKSCEAGDKSEELKLRVYKDLSAIAVKTEDLIKQTKIKDDDIHEQKELFNARLKAMEELKSLVENFIGNKNKHSDNEQQISETLRLIDNKTPDLEKLIQLKNFVCSQIEEVQQKREMKLREKNLEEERKLLKQGEPCPLCGSPHHPYVHEYYNNVSELTRQLENLEAEQKKYEAEIQNLQKEINTHSGMIEALRKEKNAIETQMKEQQSKIETRKNQLKIEKVGKVSVIEAAITELNVTVNAIREFEKVIATKRDLEDFKQAVDEFELRSNELKKAKAEVESRYKGSNIRGECDALSRQLNSYNDAIQKSETKINSYKRQLEEFSKQQTKIDASLNNNLGSFGYPDILSSFSDILPDSEFSKLKQEFADLEGNLKRIKALIHGANERNQQLLANDDTNKSKEELLQELNSTAQQIEQDKQNLANYRSEKIQNQVRKNRIEKLKQQVDETRQANLKWELLCNYIGDATGKSFSTFAQGLTLKKLIALTNERLRKLNDRYLLDIPLEEEDDDLVIIDTYLGEERRSVKTLSGGETFIVSLALALALSDLASKNVKIESLYIDEGFGSLDPDALDTAISTLEQLQIESNKTIGIISHIESLKERIETQIQLEKNSSGFSKIVIR